jgi:hypothetical protein
MKQIKLLRQELNQYLSIYIKKNDLLMKPVMLSIQDQLLSSKKITIGQFTSIIRFLEREQQFKNFNKEYLTNYFSPLISGLQPTNTSTTNTLEQFF